MTDLTLNLQADAMAAVSMATAKNETRYYLEGVFVTPWEVDGKQGVMMVATTGHILAAYFDEHGSASRPAIISGQFSGPAFRTRGSERAPRRVAITGDTARILAVPKNASHGKTVDLTLVKEIDGKFPDWTRAVPKDFSGSGPNVFAWSHIVMGLVCRIAERLNGSRQRAMLGRQAASDAPAVFTFGGDCPLVVVAMPMLADGEDPKKSTAFASLFGSPLDAVMQTENLLTGEMK